MAYILQLFDRFMNHVAHRYVTTGDIIPRRFSLILFVPLLVVLVLQGKDSVQGALKQAEPLPAVPHYIQDFRRNLPRGHILAGKVLKHKCKGGDDLMILSRRYYKYTKIFIHADFRDQIKRLHPNAFKGRFCKKGVVLTIPEPLLKPIQNRPLDLPADRELSSIDLQGGQYRPWPAEPRNKETQTSQR